MKASHTTRSVQAQVLAKEASPFSEKLRKMSQMIDFQGTEILGRIIFSDFMRNNRNT
ncbi:unnamed protein product [Moneuplotes crassus]|uniref:Uncharacterized protein n=1 Tax=Euplotes crassus TaxID=5936 RepID=A0AAD1Y111_EUPCR|nr:unnamed protein product [Moneuplotes crassus]